MIFEWDANKDRINQAKHGISFNEAKQVFDDPLHVSVLDRRFTYWEERWISVGQCQNLKITVVAHLTFTKEGEESIRIISAREATAHERKQYQQL